MPRLIGALVVRILKLLTGVQAMVWFCLRPTNNLSDIPSRDKFGLLQGSLIQPAGLSSTERV